MRAVLSDRHGIRHVTIQPELDPCDQECRSINRDEPVKEDESTMGEQHYQVQVERMESRTQVRCTVRNFTFELGADRGNPAAGANAVETLLTAVGACFTTSFGMVAGLSRVSIERLSLDVSAVRQDKPPMVTEIHYTAYIETDADDSKVDRLVRLAEKNSTVISTLRNAVSFSHEWKRSSVS